MMMVVVVAVVAVAAVVVHPFHSFDWSLHYPPPLPAPSPPSSPSPSLSLSPFPIPSPFPSSLVPSPIAFVYVLLPFSLHLFEQSLFFLLVVEDYLLLLDFVFLLPLSPAWKSDIRIQSLLYGVSFHFP